MTRSRPERIESWTSVLWRWVHRIAPPVAPPGPTALDAWRTRVLSAVCAAGLVLGLLPLGAAIVLWPTNAGVIVTADLLVYLLVLVMVRSPRVGYAGRVTTLVATFLTIGMVSVWMLGLRGAGATWLGVATVGTGMLLSGRAVVRVVAIIAAYCVLIGVGIAQGWLAWSVGVPDALRYWAISASSMVMMYLVMAVGISALLHGLQEESDARLEAESALRRSQRLDAMGTMAGGIAHDFNNLLAPILANLDLLHATPRPLDDPVVRDALGDMRTAAERARDLVRRLLVLRRGEAEARSAIDLVTTLNEVARILAAEAGDRVTIAVDARWVPAVHASETELHQIVMNLARNGVQAMPHGGALTLALTAVEAEGASHVEIVVRDTGLGMDEATRQRAFDPFFSARGDGNGTGLGLTTVHAIVATLGGTIACESSPGMGTTMRVRLPAAASTPASDGGAPRVDPALDHAQRERLRVLVVDDEPLVREGTARMLHALGHHPVAVSSVDEGLAWLATTPVPCDVIVTDHRMPERTGADLVRTVQLRAPQLATVVASGFIEEATAELADGGTSVVFLAKPFTSSELADALRRAREMSAASVTASR
ncbi:MAG: ATP-binding protein [Gemmatimonadaceae bacterium]|jgi:signal transduction histidine kinase/CheY-like chemotaxis protein|nr:ATP-binding protein [Gemmatimonadaceae bacterium]